MIKIEIPFDRRLSRGNVLFKSNVTLKILCAHLRCFFFYFPGYYYQLPIIMATGECRYLVPLRGENRRITSPITQPIKLKLDILL